MRYDKPIHLLALFLTLLGLAGAVGTSAGTVIENQALFQALPDDPADPPISVPTDPVRTVVAPVCSLSVLPNGTLTAPGQSVTLLPAESATLRYTLTNTGNAVNTFALNVTPDASSAYVPGDLSVHVDQNANGVIDSGENAVTSLELPADATAVLLVRATTETGSRGSAFVNLVAACAAALGGASDADNVARVTVADPPALSLTKSFSPSRVTPGGVVGVTLSASNGGQGASREVTVTDLLNTPDLSDFAFVPGSATGTAGRLEYSPDGASWQAGEPTKVLGVRLRLDTLAPGSSAQLTFRLTAPNSEVGQRLNVAVLTSPGTPDVPATDKVTVQYAPAIALGPISNPQALPGGELSSNDLQVQDVAFVDQEFCFKHTEQNLGDRDDNLSVRYQVTTGLATVRLLELDGSPLVQARTLAPGQTHDFQFCVTPRLSIAQALQATEIRLTVSGVRGAPENATIDRIGTLIAGTPALAKTVSPAGTVKPGDLLTYTLTVQNTLSVSLNNVVLSDPLDSHLEFVSADGGGVAQGSIVTWNLGTLAPGQTVSRTLTARVAQSTPDDTVIRNTFSLSSSEFTTPLVSPPVTTPVFGGSLVFSKTSTPAEVSIGDVVTYTFLVRNPSTVATLKMVEITDTMPAGLQYIPGSSQFNGNPIADPTITGDQHVWVLPELGPGAQHEVTFQARVLPSVVGDRVQNTAIARAVSDNGSELPSAPASATNRIAPLLFAPTADIVGYVFQDVQRNGTYDQGQDIPVQNARVILANGRIALTDATGRYHFGTVREGFAAVRLDPSSVSQAPLSVPQDGARPGSRGVYVRGLTSIDFPLAPNGADIGVIRDTTLDMGTAQTPALLQVRKMVMTTTEEGVYRVQLTLNAAAPLNGLTLNDPLPQGASLLDGDNTLSLDTLPTGERLLTYRFRFAGGPGAAVTDPVAGWRY
ncbi:isopeptide-forming domain-containing fimbrial protein [Deinococcus altitudinis]|uniref:DUF7507 domain-containing protein n=1 Tax=Deinococcus altitudinis TaxID=468914 RepID=UPI0038922CCE